MNRLKSTLTPSQLKVYNFVIQSIQNDCMPPTRAEIQHAFGWKSPNAAEEHLRSLERKGLLQLLPAVARGVRLIGIPPTLPPIPLEGSRAPQSAGTPPDASKAVV